LDILEGILRLLKLLALHHIFLLYCYNYCNSRIWRYNSI